ncbi:MAG TPA: hypothetical protein G4N94_01090 [Caldilineae bacterium]|nr:hypothetical protein [Caldilineae bacterium]
MLSSSEKLTLRRFHAPPFQRILALMLALVLLFLILGINVGADGVGHWETEFVDRPHQFQNRSNRSLQVDENGMVHLAYGQNHLFYARSDGETWQYEIVDESDRVGEFAALALDADNRPHVSYFDGVNADLKYAVETDVGWSVETVDSEGEVGWHTTIAIDVEGHPHISYYDRTNGWVKYAYQDAWGWHIDQVDQIDVDYYYQGTSLALDAQGNPYISYRGSIDRRLKYAFKDQEGVWQTQSVDTGTGGGTAIAIASDGNIHISYTAGEGLKHATLSETGWQFEIVDTEWRGHNSLILDDEDRPHVSYASDSDALKYARRDASGWHIETIDQQGNGVGWRNTIDLDDNGAIHIAYEVENPLPTLKYATNASGDWRITSIDESLRVTGPPSLDLDDFGRPRLGYRLRSSSLGSIERLKIAHHDGRDWRNEVVDAARYIDDASMALDSLGNPHFIYTFYGEDPPSSGLKYAYTDGGNWYFETVSDQPGRRPSLVLDDEDRPHISYIVGSAVKYLWRDNAVWHTETVMVGVPPPDGFVSLLLDSQGRPHLAIGRTVLFPDWEFWRLIYAYREAGGWHTETVDEPGGAFPSLALDTRDRPAISYRGGYRYEEGDTYHLRYAQRREDGWHIAQLDETDGACTSLALDKDDYPHISYFADGLRYISQNEGGWSPPLTIGRHAGCGSLVLDSTDSPAIAFVTCPPESLNWPDSYPISTPSGCRSCSVSGLSNGSLAQ